MVDEKRVMITIKESRPSFRNDHDKVAFAVHATFLAAGYMLTPTGPPAFSDDALSSPSTDEVGIENWSDGKNEFEFVYLNPKKGEKKLLVRCLVMNDKLSVDVLLDGAPKRLISKSGLFSNSLLRSVPVKSIYEVNDCCSIKDRTRESGNSNYSAQYKNLDITNLKLSDYEFIKKYFT